MTTSDKDRAAFEAWAQDYYHGTQRDIALAAWQAATAAERERAAKVCIETAKAFGANEDHAIAFGAYRCADKIRSGE